MLTPPYHFAIVAAPIGSVRSGNSSGSSASSSQDSDSNQILYRGALPSARNAPFMRRLGIKTLVCLRKKPLKDEDAVVRWSKRRGIDVKWVKAETMGEETLGMERPEVGEVLQIILNPAAYPVYLADSDGNSHTTLVVACLRKLQGWDNDSIVNEMYLFEPDYDDLPLVPFITSYLSSQGKDETALVLPPPPYPAWLWPSLPTPATRSERAVSNASTTSTGSASLPFPNPLTARRHPSMRLTFPAPSPQSKGSRPPMAPLTRVSTADRRPPSPLEPERAPHKVSFHDPALSSGMLSQSPTFLQAETTSPEQDASALDDEDEIDDEAAEEDEVEADSSNTSEDEEEEEEEEEDDDDEDEHEPVSQYISALDLAGY